MGGRENTTEEAGVPARRKFRFSLSTLVLVTALLCTVVSHVLTSWELRWLRTEARKLRDELGYLTITDTDELHAIALSPDVGFVSKRWKWKLYFPTGRRFRVCYKFTELPAVGTPDDNYEFFDDIAEEMLLTISAIPDPNGIWKLVFDSTSGISSPYSTTRSQTIANAEWLSNDDAMSWIQAGQSTTESVAPGESMILLHVRPRSQASSGGTMREVSDSSPADGIIVWIEEEVATP